MKKFGLLGGKLGHSFSPLIHAMLGGYQYPLHEIQNGDIDAFMTERNFDGCNVTIPFKQAVIPYCATLSDEAKRIGSVNTIIKDGDGQLHGHNTDYHGFRFMLEYGGIDPGGKKALILGDGGSARMVRAVLNNAITISRRGKDNYENISRHYDARLIVNTTPVGMFPDNGKSPLPLEGFHSLEAAADLIYNPMRTKLLLDAERLGVPYINGLSMLVAQAEMASRIFTGTPAKPELVAEIIEIIRKKTQNIALIGMPGSGKTTVGKHLAEMTGRPFVDIDAQIEAAAGKGVPQIFAEGGEAAFRALETRVLSEEAKKSGLVIATGGGVVTREENFPLLRQNSLLVYLKRGLTELCSDGRPLSQSVGIHELAKQRLPLYEEWCDCAVRSDIEPKGVAERILEAIF
jgi:shikimate dehydrogenase